MISFTFNKSFAFLFGGSLFGNSVETPIIPVLIPAGLYKCEAKKNYKKAEVVILVETAEKATSCTAAAPEFGTVSPTEVDIGDVVSYSCNPGYFIEGRYRLFIPTASYL